MSALDRVLQIYTNTSNMLNQFRIQEVHSRLQEARYYNSPQGQNALMQAEMNRLKLDETRMTLKSAYDNSDQIRQQLEDYASNPNFSAEIPRIKGALSMMNTDNTQQKARAAYGAYNLVNELSKRAGEAQSDITEAVQKEDALRPSKVETARQTTEATEGIRTESRKQIADYNAKLQRERPNYQLQVLNEDENGNQTEAKNQHVWVIDKTTNTKRYAGPINRVTGDFLDVLLGSMMGNGGGVQVGAQQGPSPMPQSQAQPPAGARDTGRTSGGKKVYQLPDSNYWVEDVNISPSLPKQPSGMDSGWNLEQSTINDVGAVSQIPIPQSREHTNKTAYTPRTPTDVRPTVIDSMWGKVNQTIIPQSTTRPQGGYSKSYSSRTTQHDSVQVSKALKQQLPLISKIAKKYNINPGELFSMIEQTTSESDSKYRLTIDQIEHPNFSIMIDSLAKYLSSNNKFTSR